MSLGYVMILWFVTLRRSKCELTRNLKISLCMVLGLMLSSSLYIMMFFYIIQLMFDCLVVI